MKSHTPENWDEYSQWDRYWAEKIAKMSIPKAWKDWLTQDELRFFDFVKGQPDRKVWFAGCGAKVASIFYAYAGCDVLASDFSVTAIEFLQQLARQDINSIVSDPEEMMNTLNAEKSQSLPPRFLVHDFCESLNEQSFDVVINVRAYQGLSSNRMKEAATVFYQALKPGGSIIIDTINIQGEFRSIIENILIESGFYLPFHKAECWYREQLNLTGISYLMILGRPMVQRDRYSNSKDPRINQDQETLKSLSAEYQQHREQEAQEVQEVMKAKQVKIAYVVYNTG